MKKLSIFCKTIILFSLFFSLNRSSFSQTTLAAGDIAFTGYNSSGATAAVDDKFSFVLLKTIVANTKIRFTDVGWLRNNSVTGDGVFQTITAGQGEAFVEWNSPALTAGTEVSISNLTASVGTVTFISGGVSGQGLNLPSSGDQVIAYQGTEASPTFISAIHMNVNIAGISPAPATTTTDSDWDGVHTSFNSSGLPKGLTTDVNAIWVWAIPFTIDSEEDNAKFTGCALDLSNVASVRSIVNNKANWTTNDLTGVTLPSGCTFLPNVPPSFATNPLASTLCASLSVTFNATTTSGGNTFKWQEATDASFTTGLTDITASGGLFTLISSGGNSSSLTISDNTTKNGRYYRCVATGFGSANSSGALLTATNNTFATGNISASTPIGTGNSSFIFASGCRLLGKVVPGNLTGNITVEHWLESTVPTVAGVPFVKRHY